MRLNEWLLNEAPSKRFALFTRSNAAEVMGEPLSPLGWTLIWKSAFGPGTWDGYVALGGFDREEFSESDSIYGAFGGYFYLNLSAMLILTARMPGADPHQLAAAFDSDPAMPGYVAEPWHENPEASTRLSATLQSILAGRVPSELGALQDDAHAIRAARPDLAAQSLEALVARMRSIVPAMRRNGQMHVHTGQAGMTAMGYLQTLLGGLGRGDDMARLCAGIGHVETADIAGQMWRLSRLVRATPGLSDALRERRVDGYTPAFREAFAAFLYDHGARGSNEWDLVGATFETHPENALALIESMVKQDDNAEPGAAQRRNGEVRDALLAEFDNMPAARDVRSAAEAVAAWFAARERSKNLCVRVVHEARMCAEEIARRLMPSGEIGRREHVYMLQESELADFAADPAAFRERLAERYDTYLEVARREPPFIVNGAYPPPETWPLRAEPAARPEAALGERLKGLACSPGRVTGRARIVHDPADPGLLEPGDILITATTNPSWTPLFLVAAAVVTEFGLFNSHASIVSRELGIPCVASVPGVTSRIQNGALIAVDGDTGEIEIMAAPESTSAESAAA
ncbi:MAG: PEP-utilizing enzyme [Micropepsaceae bacterium]